MPYRYIFFIFFLLQGVLCGENFYFYGGPEYDYLFREKKGGAQQKGSLIGVRAGVERLKRYKWYVGAEGGFAKGTLKGKTGYDDPIRSHFSTGFIEGRVGYTFQQKEMYQAYIAPFVGGGYLFENNYFCSPSPLQIHYHSDVPYFSVGFRSGFYPCGACSPFKIGLNGKASWTIDPRCHVSHDQFNDSVTQNMKETYQYRLELPFTYQLNTEKPFYLQLVPFYEYRAYGGHPNYPFDFLRTTIQLTGALLYLEYAL